MRATMASSKLIRNERVKALASLMNNLAAAASARPC
jgi:hypothetical protein